MEIRVSDVDGSLKVRLLGWSVGTLAGVAAAGLSAALLASYWGALTPVLSSTSLVLGLVVGGLAGRSIEEPARERPDHATLLAFAAFGVVSLCQFLGVCFESRGSFQTLLPNNYGDLPLHWTYVAFLARGAPFWPDNPIAAGERLRYPFGVDLVDALFVQLGIAIPVLFRIMGLVGAALAAHALFVWGRGFAVAAFLFSGGWAGLPLTASRALLDDPSSLAWKNLFLALFVPQRGFLFALPVGLFLLWGWRRRLLQRQPGLPAWVEGLLWGALPLFHLHTFLFVTVVMALWAILGRRLDAAWRSLAWAFVPATWSVWQVTEGFRSASLVWWKPGWVMAGRDPLVFLAANFGLWLPLVGVALALALRRRDRPATLALAPGLGLFVLLFFVMLAPWDWDNTKVMVWCFLLVLPPVFELAVRPLALSLRAALLVLLFLPGVVTVARASVPPRQPIVVADRLELESVCTAVRALGVGERVAAAPTFNHPVALCGQPLVAGYGGHLWSHGIARAPLEQRLGVLMSGGQEWSEVARALGARALFWGPREEQAFPTSSRPWEATQPLIASGPWGRLFRIDPVSPGGVR